MIQCITYLGAIASLVVLGVVVYGLWTENKSHKNLTKEIRKRGITKAIIEG